MTSIISGPILRGRNLSFTTQIAEFSLVGEYNLLEPDIFFAYPYIFGGIGLMKFNSYVMTTITRKHICIRSTRRARAWLNIPTGSLIQRLNFVSHSASAGSGVSTSSLEFVYEMGYRMIFTDYLDDVVSLMLIHRFCSRSAAPNRLKWHFAPNIR